MSNQAQLEWIGEHLKRKSLTSSALFSSVNHHAEHGYQEMAKSLKALPDEAEYREASRRMKGAWYTRQYRKKNGNPVSLQMPEGTMKKLKALAKKRKQSQVQTLTQIISKAADDQKHMLGRREKEQVLFSGNKNTEQRHEQSLYSSVESKLLDVLTDEIHSRCCLELKQKSLEEQLTDEDVRKEYLEFAQKRLLEIKRVYGDIVSTLSLRMDEKANDNGIVYLYAHLPEDII